MKVQPFLAQPQAYPRTAAAQPGGGSFEQMLDSGDRPAAGDRARSFRESGLFGKAASPAGERQDNAAGGTKQADGAKQPAKPPAAAAMPVQSRTDATHGPQPRASGRQTGPALVPGDPKHPAKAAMPAALRTHLATDNPLPQLAKAAGIRPSRRAARTRDGASGIQLRLDADDDLVGLAIAVSDAHDIMTEAVRARLAAILHEHGLGLGALIINGKDDGYGA